MRYDIAKSVGFAATSLALVAITVVAVTPTPASAGSGARTAVGIGVGAVLGAIILNEAARASSGTAARPQRRQPASKPAAERPEKEAKADTKSTVHQIDERATLVNATQPGGSAPATGDPFANSRTVKQPADQ